MSIDAPGSWRKQNIQKTRRRLSITFKLDTALDYGEEQHSSEGDAAAPIAVLSQDGQVNLRARPLGPVNEPLMTKNFIMVNKVVVTLDGIDERYHEDVFEEICEKIYDLKDKFGGTPKPIVTVRHMFERNKLLMDCLGVNVENFYEPLNDSLNRLGVRVISTHILTKRVKMKCTTEYVRRVKVLRILQYLETSYPNLRPREWYVVQSIVANDLLNMIIVMDLASANFIKTQYYKLYWECPN